MPADDRQPPGDHEPERAATRPRHGERRVAPSIAVLVSMLIPLGLPARLAPGPTGLVPILEGVFLVALVIADPGRIDRRSRQIRALSIGLVVLIAATAAWATGRLVLDLLHGDPQTSQASELLIAGALVWTDVIIAFTFLYWEVDGGGPAGRYLDDITYPDLAFPEQLNPEIAPPGWHPIFVDYLYLAITNAMAFSPTDVMPLARWAKLAMAVQSVISIVILSLVIANSVNLLGSS